MNIRKFFIVLIFLFIGFPDSLYGQEEWKYFKKVQDIAVYSKGVQGLSENEFKGVMILGHPLEKVRAVLMDSSLDCHWVEGCKSAKTIISTSNAERIVYYCLRTPWPFYDRDVFYKITVEVDKKAEKILFTGVALKNYPIPPGKKCIRIIDSRYEVTLQSIAPDKTKITYRNKTDMGGSICPFESNLLTGNFIFNSMHNLKRFLLTETVASSAK